MDKEIEIVQKEEKTVNTELKSFKPHEKLECVPKELVKTDLKLSMSPDEKTNSIAEEPEDNDLKVVVEEEKTEMKNEVNLDVVHQPEKNSELKESRNSEEFQE